MTESGARDVSQWSWAELHDHLAPRRQGSRRPAGAEYAPEDLIEEITLVLADAAKVLQDNPVASAVVSGSPQMSAMQRDRFRDPLRRGGGIGEAATFMADWLIARADRDDVAESIETARLAATSDPSERALAADLRAFVEGYLDGSIDEAEFVRRINKPRAGSPRRPAPAPPGPEAALPLSATVPTLKKMLDDATAGGSPRDPRRAWAALRRFAVLPVTGDGGESVDDGLDLLLCEWAIHPAALQGAREVLLIDLVRQFSILDAEGDFDRMEQLHCEISFDATHVLRDAGSGTIWSDQDPEAWFSAVEQSKAHEALSGEYEALGIVVYREGV